MSGHSSSVDTPFDKEAATVTTSGLDAIVDSHVPDAYHGTDSDRHDMLMLGKKQELRRNFKLITMTGFASLAICTWEGLLTLFVFVLTDGGLALLFWGFIAVALGMLLVYLSIAEIASMSPTSAGQYHWVSEFGPPKYQRVLSYTTGWLCAIGWQTFLTSVCFMVGTVIQGLIVLNDVAYVYQAWHGTMLSISVIVFAILFNTFFANKLPFTQGIAVLVHILGLFGVIIPIWCTADRSGQKASDILLEFWNYGGWSSTGLSAMIGLTTPVTVWIGYDCSAHMAEEVHDAQRNLPRSILGAMSLNGVLGFLMVCTLIFNLGDIDSILATDTGYPFLQLFYNAVGSKAAVNGMTFLVIFGLANCAITETATASRQIWSFARDNGLPASQFFARVSPGQNIPLRAVLVSLVVVTLLSLINIGSSVALNAINSLAGVSVLTSYLVLLSCIVWRRIWGAPLPPRPWSLGRAGLCINVGALAFILPIWFFAFWPLATPVTAANMNWSSTVFGGVVIIAALHWFVKARHVYTGPVVQMRRDL